MMRRAQIAMVALAVTGCGESAPILPPPPPGPPPTLATISIAGGGSRVQGFAGRSLPDEVVTLLVTGSAAATEQWTASSHRGWAQFDTPSGTGSGELRWNRGVASQGPGLHVDTVEVSLTAHPGVMARVVDTIEVLPMPASLTMLVSPRSRAVRITHGDDVPDGSVTVTLAPTATDGASWCVNASTALTLMSPLPTANCDPAATGGVVRWHRNIAGRGPGIHVDTITIWRNAAIGSPVKVLDSLIVLPGPGPFFFGLSDSSRADTIDVGGTAVEDMITVRLQGKGAAAKAWTSAVEANPGWLSVITGVGSGESVMRWRRDPSGLAAGVYSARIIVSLAGEAASSIAITDTLVVKGANPGSTFDSPTTLWAGGEFHVSGAALSQRGEGASLALGTLRIPLLRHDATTLSAVLPDSTPGGVVTPALLLDGYRIPLSTATIHGFTRSQAWDRSSLNDTYAWPRDGAASALGQGSEGLVLFDLDAGTSRVLDVPSTTNVRGPGPTPDPDVFMIRNGGRVQSWRLRPVPQLVELFDDFYNTSTRQIMQMSANAMFIAPGQHEFSTYSRPNPATPFARVVGFEQAEEVEGVYLSPRHDRATVRVDGVTLGVPIFDAVTATIAYRAPMRGSHGVDWSTDGARLLMGGRGMVSPYSPRLVVLDAGTGGVLQARDFAQTIASVAWDDLRPYSYVVLEDRERGLSLQVLDKSTLEVVATMRPPGAAEAATDCCYRAVIAPSRLTNTVHVFWWRYSWTFTLPAP